MSGDNQITIGSYIQYSLKAALKLVKLNPHSMEYFDLSSDGFWKSFWAIAVMVPGLVMVSMFQYQGVVNQASPEETMAYPFLSNVVFFSLALPFTAFVMAYFTKFMKIIMVPNMVSLIATSVTNISANGVSFLLLS